MQLSLHSAHVRDYWLNLGQICFGLNLSPAVCFNRADKEFLLSLPPPVNAAAQHDGSVVAGEGEGTTQNDSAWRSISDFLSLQFLRQEMAKRAAAASRGPACGDTAQPEALTVTPDGNHGET